MILISSRSNRQFSDKHYHHFNGDTFYVEMRHMAYQYKVQFKCWRKRRKGSADYHSCWPWKEFLKQTFELT